MNIAIYARVSTAAQAEKGYSLETQVEACEKKAVSLGATFIKKYIDAAKIHKAMKPKKLTYAEKRNAILSVCSKIYITRAGGKYGKKYELKIDFVFK